MICGRKGRVGGKERRKQRGLTCEQLTSREERNNLSAEAEGFYVICSDFLAIYDKSSLIFSEYIQIYINARSYFDMALIKTK